MASWTLARVTRGSFRHSAIARYAVHRCAMADTTRLTASGLQSTGPSAPAGETSAAAVLSSARTVQTAVRAANADHGLSASRVLRLDSVNQQVVKADYAVRGELAIRAEKYKEQLARGDRSLPFEEIIHCNIGNPQQLAQKPITFFRQVSSLLEMPELLSLERQTLVTQLYPVDAVERARVLHRAIGSIGAYSHSMGIPHIRQNVANFIQANPEHIFLTSGASDGVKMVLNVLINSPNTGILIPIPQYPLYSASLALFNGRAVPYSLNESEDWSLSTTSIEASVREARARGVDVRALVVINPGNPTGQCLDIENMKQVVDVCKRLGLVLMADEVYQTNVYDHIKRPFHSFKKVVHSISKGMVGECGRRGGYLECSSIDPEVLAQLYKLASISLCPSVQGQVMVDLMVKPPQSGDVSYEQYQREVTDIYESLRRRAVLMVDAFRQMEGATCNYAQGAMYVFPRIRLPPKAIASAKQQGVSPDTFYALAMLDATGVCVVPGSGFGQEEGTFHFRSTFLPPEAKFSSFIEKVSDFHKNFMDKYR